MDKNTRSLRRAQKEKMKLKAKRIFYNDPLAGLLADNMAYCSCYWCGNPRKHPGCKSLLTFKDKQANIILKEEIKNFNKE